MGKTCFTKVLIVDNHPLFCFGLSTFLKTDNRFNVVGIASNSDEAIKLTEKECPKLVIMEIRLCKEKDASLIKKLKTINPKICVLVLSSYDEQFFSERVMRLGASGYVMKTETCDTVMEAILTVLEGNVYLSKNEKERLFLSKTDDQNQFKDLSSYIQRLSNREIQVLTLLGKGYETEAIASTLKVSAKTVETHMEHLKQKLHCKTSQLLRRQAFEWVKINEN